ncbi:MAG: septum formation initiator family protein [Clostridium sp.]|nr:septum formation initiator family protein [Clostridium sp.]
MAGKAGQKSKTIKSFVSNKKNIPMLLAIVALVILFIFFGVTMVNQGADISRMERQRDEIALKVDAQLETNKELQAVLDNENKDDYIEQKAREKGYVKSDEIVFYDISASE